MYFVPFIRIVINSKELEMNIVKQELQKEFVRVSQKNAAVSLRCTDKEKRHIRRAAKGVGLSVSAYLLKLHQLATVDDNELGQ